jgi:hypothetical protein
MEDIMNQVERPCEANSRQRYKRSANDRIKNSSRFVVEIRNLYDGSVNKVPPSLMFPPEAISL